MCLQIPLEDRLQEERELQQTINSHIDEYHHIKFNAGAGAGKTHALKESLLYIIQNYSKKLKYHNQKILCITYTNVATDEIKDRIGNSSFVKVSTIHERVWELIKNYQKELVQIHKQKIDEELTILRTDLSDENNSKYVKYQSLNSEEQEGLKQVLLENREVYYRNKDKNAAGFKSAFNSLVDSNLMSNVGNFKAIIKAIYKISDYQVCLEKIDSMEYKSVIYDSKQNSDSLHRMKISHDTLLEYGLTIIEQYDTLKKIIINKFPYILIDEYQDTAHNVIQIINSLSIYAQQINYNLFIGYFGDTAQNIYDTGVGSNINEIHPNLIEVNKRFNRRSAKQVIEVINKIRNDDIEQVSIYSDDDCGSVEFYQGHNDNINGFIQKCKIDWQLDFNNQLHCFVLKNELVAGYNGFENIYNKLKSSKRYSGLNYQDLNMELVTYDTTKFGVVQSLFYSIIELKQLLENEKTVVEKILNKNIYNGLNFQELNNLISLLKSITGITLKEYIENFLITYADTQVKGFKEKVENLFTDIEILTLDGISSFLLEKLYKDIEDEGLEEARSNINSLLEVDIEEYIKWFNFVNRIETEEVIYHTYHGTKGLEFDNVVIVMENKFGIERNKFSNFFTNPSDNENTKNLLYVACSRARRNLRIFYLDDVTDFKSGIENIFDEVLEFDITT